MYEICFCLRRSRDADSILQSNAKTLKGVAELDFAIMATAQICGTREKAHRPSQRLIVTVVLTNLLLQILRVAPFQTAFQN
jgi:hypothetical protein